MALEHESARRLCARWVGLALLVGCGAGDEPAPYTPPPPSCRAVDDYLAELYTVIDEGGVEQLATTIRDRIPDDTRRDLVDALLRLLSGFAEGRFSALAADLDQLGDGPGLQQSLGAVVRYLAEGPHDRGPDLAFLATLRTASATCDGAPVFSLLAAVTRDEALVPALVATLSSEALREVLADLSLEGANGREAFQLLVRNLLVSASGSAFDIDSLLSLLGILLGDAADTPPLSDLIAGVKRVFSAPSALDGLQATLVCLRRVDSDLTLGGFLYDLVTSGVLQAVDTSAITLPRSALDLATDALDFLAHDAIARRALKAALLALLAEDIAPPVLGDVATLLEREALAGVAELISAIASGECKLAGQVP